MFKFYVLCSNFYNVQILLCSNFTNLKSFQGVDMWGVYKWSCPNRHNLCPARIHRWYHCIPSGSEFNGDDVDDDDTADDVQHDVDDESDVANGWLTGWSILWSSHRPSYLHRGDHLDWHSYHALLAFLVLFLILRTSRHWCMYLWFDFHWLLFNQVNHIQDIAALMPAALPVLASLLTVQVSPPSEFCS